MKIKLLRTPKVISPETSARSLSLHLQEGCSPGDSRSVYQRQLVVLKLPLPNEARISWENHIGGGFDGQISRVIRDTPRGRKVIHVDSGQIQHRTWWNSLARRITNIPEKGT